MTPRPYLHRLRCPPSFRRPPRLGAFVFLGNPDSRSPSWQSLLFCYFCSAWHYPEGPEAKIRPPARVRLFPSRRRGAWEPKPAPLTGRGTSTPRLVSTLQTRRAYLSTSRLGRIAR